MMVMRVLVGVLFFLAATTLSVYAQQHLVVMNTAAHPDDEDGATLTYYRHAKDALAYSVIYTRGEGGQNEIGPELYEELGAIRTDESERAARHLGTQLFFLNFEDFGYSKHADEAFEEWGGRDAVTARLVYLIRKLKPDVIFTNHDTVTVGPQRQHGQHQAVGLSTYDAFALASDPAYHPEQLEEEGVDLWQPKRLFLRTWQSSERTVVSVPVGAINPATGEPYAAYAAHALREHASQGMDRWADRMQSIPATHFELLRTATEAPFVADDLAANLPPNTQARPSLAYRIDAGRVPLLPKDALILDDDVAVPGQTISLSWDPATFPASQLRWQFFGALDSTVYLADSAIHRLSLQLPADASPTVPHAVHQYTRFENRFPIGMAVYDAQTDELLAGGYLPLNIAPPVHLELAEPVVRLHAGKNEIKVRAQVFDPAIEALTVNLAVANPTTRTVETQQHSSINVQGAGPLEHTIAYVLPADLETGTYTLTVSALPQPTTLVPRAVTAEGMGRAFKVAVAEPLKVGVVQSYDDAMAVALENLGVNYVLLDSTALASRSFADLHTILVDIRAYLVRADLRTHNDRLLDWVAEGGHLVVNYQKTFEWNDNFADPFVEGQNNPSGFAPYALKLGRDRVTREDAPVTVRHPDHPLLHSPNPISQNDWDGWVQERGLYFPATYSDAYTELFCMNDPGEAPLCSSTLLTTHGEGSYVYTALGWYRQLKLFHPGAYAFFANLISYPLTRGESVETSANF